MRLGPRALRRFRFSYRSAQLCRASRVCPCGGPRREDRVRARSRFRCRRSRAISPLGAGKSSMDRTVDIGGKPSRQDIRHMRLRAYCFRAAAVITEAVITIVRPGLDFLKSEIAGVDGVPEIEVLKIANLDRRKLRNAPGDHRAAGLRHEGSAPRCHPVMLAGELRLCHGVPVADSAVDALASCDGAGDGRRKSGARGGRHGGEHDPRQGGRRCRGSRCGANSPSRRWRCWPIC